MEGLRRASQRASRAQRQPGVNYLLPGATAGRAKMEIPKGLRRLLSAEALGDLED